MPSDTVRLLGSCDSGLIIHADLPAHLIGNGPKERALILTPAQVIELHDKLVARVAEFRQMQAARVAEAERKTGPHASLMMPASTGPV